MSLGSCIVCWNNPCECGHDYECWSEEDLIKQIMMFMRVLTVKQEGDGAKAFAKVRKAVSESNDAVVVQLAEAINSLLKEIEILRGLAQLSVLDHPE